MTIREDIPLAPLTTFRMGPVARYLLEVAHPDELPQAFAFIREKGLPFFVLGGGSNTIFTEEATYEGVVLKIAIPGFEISGTEVRVGAGENWDDVVARAIAQGLSGIEAMSAIPGSSGAAPIQNIGAYGQELDRVLTSVDVYDYEENVMKTLPREACGFSYRDSIFKHEKRYVVTGLTLTLSKDAPKIPDYPDPIAYFAERGITRPTLTEIREAIVEIRRHKLPDPRDIASVGSFFKNPFVGADLVERYKKEFPRTVIFPTDDGRFKVGAGWMLETLGFKGQSFGNLSLYEHHALVVVNNGQATYGELDKLVSFLTGKVRERFGVDLEPEPVFV